MGFADLLSDTGLISEEILTQFEGISDSFSA